jgi:enamine deaminase RidA (YjgF/YER057c/UK114 family)
MKTYRNPESVHPPLAAYTHQIEVTDPRRWLVLSGQIGRTLDGVVPPDPIEQMNLALANVTRNLEAAGMGVPDVVKLTIYLVGEVDPTRREEAISGWLGGHQPCMTLLYVAALAAPVLRCEMDAWAARA